jgi:hypothetical protein
MQVRALKFASRRCMAVHSCYSTYASIHESTLKEIRSSCEGIEICKKVVH